MAVFYMCIMLIGSGMTMFAIFLILAEKRRLHDYRSDIKQKKEELINVIEDCEELISEMNKYSDYVVTQIEDKNNILTQALLEADLKIELLNTHDGYEHIENNKQTEEIVSVYDEAAITRILDEEKPEPVPVTFSRKGKVLTFDVKRREIIKLAKSGLDSTDIARMLNCGKGEIELIAKMGR